IQLGSVGAAGEVPLNVQDVNLTDFARLGAINLSSASLNASGNGGGTVVIRGGQMGLNAAKILTNKNGDVYGTGKSMDISGESVTLTNGASIQSQTFNSGHGGSVQITARDTIALDGPLTGIFADTNYTGGAGNITVNAKNITLTNGAVISSDATIGDAGN